MKRAPIFTAALLIALSVSRALAADPLFGRWLLGSQEIDGRKTEINELTLRITAQGQAIEFAYSVPVNNVQFVSLRFTARPDGSEADMTNANGQKIGTAKLIKANASQYRVIVEGPNKPTATSTATVSADGKTLTWQSESKQPGQNAVTHMTQVFSRQ